MFDRRNVTAVLVAGVLATGCGEGTTEPPAEADRLAADEAVALFTAFEVFRNDDDSSQVPSNPAGPNVDIVADCPLGGQVRVTGTEDAQVTGDTLRLVMDVNVVPTACRLSRDGLEFTIDGAPSMRDRSSATLIPSLEVFNVRIEGTTAGTLDWELADRSGSCAIDLVLSGEADPSAPEPAVTATWSGTLCGHAVEFPAETGLSPGDQDRS